MKDGCRLAPQLLTPPTVVAAYRNIFNLKSTSIASPVAQVIVSSIKKDIKMPISPFTGSIEFKLIIRAFDAKVIRTAKIDYTYTSTWPFPPRRLFLSSVPVEDVGQQPARLLFRRALSRI